ncbi:hypothetical protein VPH35_022450 [Triticum aestivum]
MESTLHHPLAPEDILLQDFKPSLHGSCPLGSRHIVKGIWVYIGGRSTSVELRGAHEDSCPSRERELFMRRSGSGARPWSSGEAAAGESKTGRLAGGCVRSRVRWPGHAARARGGASKGGGRRAWRSSLASGQDASDARAGTWGREEKQGEGGAIVVGIEDASDAGAGEGMRFPDERGGVGGRRGRRSRHRGRKRRASLAHVGDRCGSPWRPGSMQQRDEVARVRAGRCATAGAGNGGGSGDSAGRGRRRPVRRGITEVGGGTL